jgi:beta-N-acetylhexosaminidase
VVDVPPPTRAQIRRRRLTALAVLAALVAGGVALARSGGDEPAASTQGSTPVAGSAASRENAAAPADGAGGERERLTLRQLVGQRLVASFRGTSAPPRRLVERIRRGELGGVILFAENTPSIARTRALARRLQAIPRPAGLRAPLLVMVDQEGGLVRRVPDAPPSRSARQLAAAGPAAVERAGRATGAALRRAGINVNLAPVADVPRAGSAMLRENRTFGRARVGPLAARFARGLVAGRVHATAKHFPGFGAARENTDFAPVTIGLSAGALRSTDYASVRGVVDAGARLVMLSNAIYPSLDRRRPATLSRRIATTELRERLRFDGVSVTDDLEADALRRFGRPADLGVASAAAGADLLLFGRTYAATESAAAAIERAARAGRIARKDLEASAARVLALRESTR